MEDDVERLLKQQTDNNIGAIWIAGRGTSDYKWRYMNDFEFKVYIAVNISVVILATGAIGVTIFLVKRRIKRRRTEDDHSINDKGHTISSNQTTTDGPEYANITIVPYDCVSTQEKEIQPCAEVGLEKRFKNFMEIDNDKEDAAAEEPITEKQF
ncbi:hypothetical protein LSH36_932g01074 [Paralvinella palmiformis]|uniref:Uncharacterized protein n=1 Tax=Paralvinella palmiformis TaxID=53620 RepID=A0AAD9IYG5_9ANNE|nr:hypothetical protein LSH36_932g01074 [Paralvinella palmiformis]